LKLRDFTTTSKKAHAQAIQSEKMHMRDEINLRVLKGHDASIRGVRKQTPYVVLYNYSVSEGSWSKRPYEGTLFVYETQARHCGYTILNRLALDCFSRNIESDADVMETEGYIIHRTGDDIWGIWIWDSKDRAELFSAMQRAGMRSRKTAAGKSKPVAERTKESAVAESIVPPLPPVEQIIQESSLLPTAAVKEGEDESAKFAATELDVGSSNDPQRSTAMVKAAPQMAKPVPIVDLTQKEPEEGFSDDGLEDLEEANDSTGIRYDPESFERDPLASSNPKKPTKPKKAKERQQQQRQRPQSSTMPSKAQTTRPLVDLTMKEPEEGFSNTDAPALLEASQPLDVSAMFAHAAQLRADQSDYDSADMYKR
jgi:hypothetical protein